MEIPRISGEVIKLLDRLGRERGDRELQDIAFDLHILNASIEHLETAMKNCDIGKMFFWYGDIMKQLAETGEKIYRKWYELPKEVREATRKLTEIREKAYAGAVSRVRQCSIKGLLR